jgi:hypothetical protein
MCVRISFEWCLLVARSYTESWKHKRFIGVNTCENEGQMEKEVRENL